MNTAELLALVVDALEDIKAQNLQVFDTTPLTSLFERVIICNGTSNRQTRALADHVREKVKAAGEGVLSVEGEESGEWVLVDMGNIVVHIMQPMIRDYYRLEELWGAHPMDLADIKPSAKKASSRAPAAKKAPSKTAASKRSPVRQDPSQDTAAATKKVASKKTSANSATSGTTGTVATKTAAKKTPAVKKVAAKKVAVKTISG